MIPLDQREGYIWMDGGLVPWREATLHVLTHALHMGGAVFEGIRTYGGRVLLVDEHLVRLERSAELLGFAIPWSADELRIAIEALLWANGLQDAYVRPIAWRGAESVSVSAGSSSIHVAIAAWEWWPAGRGGVRLELASWRRPSPDTAPTASKCSGLYMIGTLARHAANLNGYDDALMLDADGFIAETTATNIIFVDGRGTIVSPVADCFLDGITKRLVFRLAEEQGFSVDERKVTLTDVLAAKECFLAGTAAEVTPVIELRTPDVQRRWSPGPVFEALSQAFDAVKRNSFCPAPVVRPVMHKSDLICCKPEREAI